MMIVSLTYAQVRWLVLSRDAFTCFYCGRSPVDDKVKLHLDHVRPVKLGGITTFSNCVASCSDCNMSKGCKEFTDEHSEMIQAILLKRNRIAGLEGKIEVTECNGWDYGNRNSITS